MIFLTFSVAKTEHFKNDIPFRQDIQCIPLMCSDIILYARTVCVFSNVFGLLLSHTYLTKQTKESDLYFGMLGFELSIRCDLSPYADINLTGYHPPPRAPRGFCSEMCAQPQGFCTTENARGAGPKMTMSLRPAFA